MFTIWGWCKGGRGDTMDVVDKAGGKGGGGWGRGQSQGRGMHMEVMQRNGRGLFKASNGGTRGHDTTLSQRFWEMEGVQGGKGGLKGGQGRSPAGGREVSLLGQPEQLFKMM